MTGLSLANVVTDVVSQLDAAGLRATADPRDVNPPCVLVGPPTPSPNGWTLARNCEIYLVPLTALVPNTGRINALAALDLLTGAILDALEGIPDSCLPADFIGTGGGDPLPGYALTYLFHYKGE